MFASTVVRFNPAKGKRNDFSKEGFSLIEGIGKLIRNPKMPQLLKVDFL